MKLCFFSLKKAKYCIFYFERFQIWTFCGALIWNIIYLGYIYVLFIVKIILLIQGRINKSEQIQSLEIGYVIIVNSCFALFYLIFI